MNEFEILEGIDLCEVSRMGRDLRIPNFASSFCSLEEMQRCDQMQGLRRAEAYAFLWAAKEAVVKAVSTEILDGREVLIRGDRQKPEVVLRGKALEIAQQMGVAEIKLSLARTRTDALAHCLAIRRS